MSSQPALPLTSPLFADSKSRADGRLAIGGLTLNGLLLFLIGLLVVASGFQSLRPDVGGLSLHPYLIPVAVALPLAFMARLHLIPVRVLAAMAIFYGLYFFSVFNGSLAIGEIFKMGGALATILVCACWCGAAAISWPALGLSLAVAVLASRSFQAEVASGVETIEGANRNSYSLFALPAVLLAGYILLNFQSVPIVIKWLLAACLIPSVAAIFMGANRSGYIGVVIVAFMLFWQRRARGLIVLGAIGAMVALLVLRFGDTSVLDERLRQTVEGNKSDNLRKEILLICFQIGLENPLIGVSPQRIQLEIGRRLSVVFNEQRVIDSHNVFAHLFAASGMICFASLFYLGWILWTWRPRDNSPIGGKEDPLNAARGLLRMTVVLWAVRGLFTREVLYNPSFNIALGLAIGLCLLAETAREPAANAAPLPAGAGEAGPGVLEAASG